MRDAEQNAHEACAKQGKQAVILDEHRNDSALTRTAAVTLVCVDPKDLVHTTDAFGALLYADARTKGAVVVGITPGSIADKAYLKVEDVIYEFGGTAPRESPQQPRLVARAAAHRAPGSQVRRRATSPRHGRDRDPRPGPATNRWARK